MPVRLPALLLAAALAVTGCGTANGTAGEDEPMQRATMVPDVREAPSADALPGDGRVRSHVEDGPKATSKAVGKAQRTTRYLRGIDVSHHQGAIDWERVAADRVEFAWLKATEGTGFVDPRYAENRRGASEAGLRVGGYHYFSICADGAPQAEHFVEVVGDQSDAKTTLPPALDVELDDSCDPSRDELLQRLRAFLEVAEAGTGRRVVVYVFPDLEERYDVARALDRPLWIRRLGNREPQQGWLVWQKSQTATVDGVDGGVDLDLMHP